MLFHLFVGFIALPTVISFPWMADMPGVDSTLLKKDHANGKRDAACPNNPNHPGAVPFNPQFPYTGAKDGLPGTQIGGVEVPNDNDVAHRFEAPGPLDIRGPCPGLNTAANHHVSALRLLISSLILLTYADN